MEPIWEFLCEAFCLVDILDEIQLSTSPEKRQANFVRDLSAEKHW
jgi:hypothetical protein